jgi:hypothetical protein
MCCTPSNKGYWPVIISFVTILFVSCGHTQESDIVASFGDHQLTQSTIFDIIPDNITPDDSSALAEKYIKDWLIRQIIIDAAENSLSDDQLSFDKMVEEYANSLKIHSFEAEWVRQKLDTNISEAEVLSYYEENKANFELKQFLVKIKFTSIRNDYRQLSTLKKYFLSDRQEDIVKWQQACVAAGANSFVSEDEWMTWGDFLKQVPVEIVDVAGFLRKHNSLEFEKDGLLYLIRFMEYKLSGTMAPIEFERERIQNLILNRRKRELLDKMRVDLYSKAEAEKRIIISAK